MDPSLLSFSCVEAPYPVAQDAVSDVVQRLFRDTDVELPLAVFRNAGIERRTLACPIERYAQGLDSRERHRLFLETGEAMLREAVGGVDTRGITHVVSVCSTGIAAPSLECLLDLDPAVRRIPVFGLGCAGGVAGLSIAADLARGGARVLVLCLELTSLTLLADDLSRRNFVACALFGDGAAAAVVGAGTGLATLGRHSTRLFPETSGLMGWEVEERGWKVVFSPRIPGVVRREVAGLVDEVADRRALRHYLLHPGGAKVLQAYRDALDLTDDDLAPATRVLARHGNMSSVTVFFVLRAAGGQAGPAVMSAFGPGFTSDLLALDLCG